MPAVAEAAEELSREAEDLLKSVFVARRIVSFFLLVQSLSPDEKKHEVLTAESLVAASGEGRKSVTIYETECGHISYGKTLKRTILSFV